MDDLDALAQLARRLNPAQLTALIQVLARQAADWEARMALVRPGDRVRHPAPYHDQQLVLALRQCARETEAAWGGDEARRASWNAALRQQYGSRAPSALLPLLGAEGS